MTTTDYETQAREVAERIGLQIAIRETVAQKCPPWKDTRPGQYGGCPTCNTYHGLEYRVTITSPHNLERLTFPFWGSKADADAGKAPTVYDILATIGSDASSPTDPDEVAEEYGPMRPSQAIAVAAFAKKLQAFFTDAELAAIQEVQ